MSHSDGRLDDEYTHDASGRLTGVTRDGTAKTLTYDSMDHITRVFGSGVDERYEFDGMGRRVRNTKIGSEARRFLVAPNLGDGYESPQAVADESGNLIATFVYAGEHPIMKIGPDGYVEYLLADLSGSVIGTSDAAGVLINTLAYDAFGTVIAQAGNDGITAAVGFEHRFHGMSLDAGTGLYFVRARSYDSATGRFVSRDRVGGVTTRPETMNPYPMDHGNPYVWRDPSGLFSLAESMAVSTAIGVGASLGLPSLNNFFNSVRAYKSGSDARIALSITNYGTGVGDTLSFGLGHVLRDLGGIQGVDLTAPEYYAGMATGVAAQFWAGFFTAGAASTSAALYFEETAPQATDHIILGLEGFGLEQTAAQMGGRTLMSSMTWQTDLMEAIANPTVKISVSLRGLSGTSTYDKVMTAAGRGAVGWRVGGNTNWELHQLLQAGRLRSVQFLDDVGRVVENPFL